MRSVQRERAIERGREGETSRREVVACSTRCHFSPSLPLSLSLSPSPSLYLALSLSLSLSLALSLRCRGAWCLPAASPAYPGPLFPVGDRGRPAGDASTEETRHTMEPLAWHWSHWPGRLVNRKESLFSHPWPCAPPLPSEEPTT